MFAVAWGERAVELLARSATSFGHPPERAGALAVTGAPGADEGDWRCWISGRVTNARELQESLGLPRATDAPSLLAGLCARHGLDGCGLLRGTFVAVALDRERGVGAVVRDHLGGRPLVYATLAAGALLAEHERAIVAALPRAPAPDRLALAQWIERGSVPHGRTLFEGILSVPPAHRALLTRAEVRVERYWRPRYEGVAAGARAEIAERLRAAAFAAVQRAAEGSGRPALRLSGGLDSACVAAGLAARSQPAPGAIALGATFPGVPETDERELIEATARHAGLPLVLSAFDGRASILAPALEHLERWSLPPVTPNVFVWRPVMARARSLGVDAMLDGEGGDELFAFAPYLIADRLAAGRLLDAWRLTRRIPEVGLEADRRMRLRALRLLGVSALLPDALRGRRRRGSPTPPPGSLLRSADAGPLRELEREVPAQRLDGPRWWRALAGGLTRGGDALGVSAHLRRESSEEGIDRRHPFLFDLELLSVVLAIPPELQFDPARDRALLRDALVGRIPEAVRTRHAKSFFTGLLAAGLAAEGPAALAGLRRADAPVRAFVCAEALDELLGGDAQTRAPRAARRLWNALLADVWLRKLESGLSADAR